MHHGRLGDISKLLEEFVERRSLVARHTHVEGHGGELAAQMDVDQGGCVEADMPVGAFCQYRDVFSVRLNVHGSHRSRDVWREDVRTSTAPTVQGTCCAPLCSFYPKSPGETCGGTSATTSEARPKIVRKISIAQLRNALQTSWRTGLQESPADSWRPVRQHVWSHVYGHGSSCAMRCRQVGGQVSGLASSADHVVWHRS